MERLREARLKQLKELAAAREEHLALGHGEYREIVEEEFLGEVTRSKQVVLHLFHKEFPRCKIYDKHLRILVRRALRPLPCCAPARAGPARAATARSLHAADDSACGLAAQAPKHVHTKFIHMDAEKAPFFVGKLKVRVLPTLISFIDGVAVDRITGMEGLGGDEFPTSRLRNRLRVSGVLKKPGEADDVLDVRARAPPAFRSRRHPADRVCCVAGLRRGGGGGRVQRRAEGRRDVRGGARRAARARARERPRRRRRRRRLAMHVLP